MVAHLAGHRRALRQSRLQSAPGHSLLRRGLAPSASHQVHREGRVRQLPVPEGLPAALRAYHEEEQVDCYQGYGCEVRGADCALAGAQY